MYKYFHQVAMWVILLGGLILLYLAWGWIKQGNIVMFLGMFLMSVLAFSNLYLHGEAMKRENDK